MDILHGLNPEQLSAVEHDLGPQLVVAGAGTGKTQVITRRIAYLIAQGKAKPTEILALTFTEKAAREMQERLYELIGWESFQVPVLTFHAFGAELLGKYATHIGRSIRGGLINDTQKALLLQQYFKRVSLKYYGPQNDLYEFLEGIVDYIGQLQNAGITPARYGEYVAAFRNDPQEMHPKDIDEQDDLARLYTLYEEIKREIGAYDYNDQLHLPLEILRRRPNLAERLKNEYRYVLVDEYQDTNAVQDALLKMFVGRDGNIFAVGDDDQAIYGFRGAEINNILAFAEYFQLPKPAVLVRNYRSGQAVLDAAYKLIQHNNPVRLEEKLSINKRLVALHNDSRVSYVPYVSSLQEQEGVLENIQERLRAGEPASSIAVLSSTHLPLKSMAKAMVREGVPFAISTSVSIFEQPELIALWYLLKWLKLEASDEAIAHIVVGPFIGWSADQFRKLLEVSQQDLTGIEEAIRQSSDEHCQVLAGQLDQWRDWAKELPVSQLAFRLIFDSGLAERWQRQAAASPRMVRVFEDLHRLLEQMQDFETVALSPDLGSYLEVFPKPPGLEVSEPLGDAGGVQLLTVHAAKGLEFPTVYLVGVTRRSWSAGRGLGRPLPADLTAVNDMPPDHEFRRLMYVAITRAKSELIVSSPVTTASGAKQMISPFVTEMIGDEAVATSPLLAQNEKESSEVLKKIQRYYPLNPLLTSDKLPFETDDGWLELSVTALGGYDFCPFEFYIQNVLRIVSPMGPQLEFGSLLHRVFELHNKSVMGGHDLGAAELHRLLDDSWTNRGYIDAQLAEADRVLAHQTLDGFLTRESTLHRRIIGSEVPIKFEIPEAKLRLRGKIDVLTQTKDGIEIRDYKTGRTKTDPEKLTKLAKDNFQLRTYALALEHLRGELPAAVVLDYVVTMVEGESQLSATILRNHRAKLVDMASKIRSRDFAPNTASLHVCAAIRYYGVGEQDEQMQLARERMSGNNDE